MRLSITVNFFAQPLVSSLDECIADMQRCYDLGYRVLDAIMCQTAEPDSFLRLPDWEERMHILAQAAKKIGVEFGQSHVPFYNVCQKPSTLPEDIDDMVDRSIRAAGILGAPWTVIHPGTALGDPSPLKRSKQLNLDYMRKRLETAEDCGVGLAIENMNAVRGGGRERRYCSEVEELCDLIDTLRQESSLVGACWDFGHGNTMYASQAGALKYLGERLKVTHVHDNNTTRDDHVSPFRGNINWAEVMRTLAEMDYQHDFSYEVKRIADVRVPEEIKTSLRQHLKVVGDYLISLFDEAKASL